MKPLVILCLLLGLAVTCAAQDASGPLDPVVRAETWPFSAADTLQKAGIAFGYPDQNPMGRRFVTRYGFAVAVLRVFAQMPEKDAVLPQTHIGRRLKQSPLAVNALLALTDEFRPELIRMQQDVSKAQDFLEVLREKQRQDIYRGKILLTPEQLQNPFAELSNRDPAWRESDILGRAGVIVGASEGTGDLLPVTRLQMAISISRLLSQLPASLELTNRLQQHAQPVPALRALIVEFSPELKLLGNNPDNDLTQLAEMEKMRAFPLVPKPFTDVPNDHWAAAAVESLRLHGLLVGYGDGKVTFLP